MKIHGRLQCC